MQFLPNEDESKILLKIDGKYYDVTHDAELINLTILAVNLNKERGNHDEAEELEESMERAFRRGIKTGALPEYEYFTEGHTKN